MSHHRELAHALLRATVGITFLFFGVGKVIKGVGPFASSMRERMADSPLPPDLVSFFATILPFAEILLGLLLLLGLFTRLALAGTALLIMFLTFGTVMEPDPATVARNVNYALVVFVLLWLADHDRYSIDRWRRRDRSRG